MEVKEVMKEKKRKKEKFLKNQLKKLIRLGFQQREEDLGKLERMRLLQMMIRRRKIAKK